MLGGLFKAVVNTAILPVAIVKDAVDIATGEQPGATQEQLEAIAENLDEVL